MEMMTCRDGWVRMRLMLGSSSRFEAASSKNSIASPNTEMLLVLCGFADAVPVGWFDAAVVMCLSSALSHIETEIDDVAFLHYVLAALAAQPASFLHGGEAAQPLQVVERCDLRADKAALDVAMDLASGLGRLRPLRDRPGA